MNFTVYSMQVLCIFSIQWPDYPLPALGIYSGQRKIEHSSLIAIDSL